ncbi:hypothetical protein LIER_16652 [Lithospermum erythrorhizon]|uniref:Uncharacterized protein n=1 Tax=Lithospermum erythrorhizon TaxID=34254 RepID=A0AAV3QAL3_LITER
MSLKKDHDLEIIKAVAQAWLGHSSATKATNEFDAYRRNFKNKPSRFKLEASTESNTTSAGAASENINGWDFRESLLDTYEIVALSRKLETGLMLDHQPFPALSRQASRSSGGKKESKNSLRNLFTKMTSSSRRFNMDDLPWENGS